MFAVDWVFRIPHEYVGCDRSEAECEGRYLKKYEFNRYVDAVNSLKVTCTETKDNAEKLPDWEWKAKGTITIYTNVCSNETKKNICISIKVTFDGY